MRIAGIAFSGFLALLYAATGVGKLVGAKPARETAEHLRIPWDRFRLIGIPEVAASVGLVIGLSIAPLGVAAASGAVVLMTCALLIRVRVHDSWTFLLGDAVFLALAAAAAVLRIATR
jgi:hypothetical protein